MALQRQYRWFGSGLWLSQSGNAAWVLLNPLGSGKKVTINRIEVYNQKQGYTSYRPIVDVVVRQTSISGSQLGGEDVKAVPFDSDYPLPGGITIRRNASAPISGTSRTLRMIYAYPMTTGRPWWTSALGPKVSKTRQADRNSFFIEHRSGESEEYDPVTVRPGEFLALASVGASPSAKDGIPVEVNLIFKVNGHCYSCVAIPCFASLAGSQAFVLLNESSYPVYVKRLFWRNLGTSDTPYFRLVPVGAVDAFAFGDQFRRADPPPMPIDSSYGPLGSNDPMLLLDVPLLPYGVPQQYIADASAGTPKGVNYLHTKDFWGPVYSVSFPEYATSVVGVDWKLLTWLRRARVFEDSKFGLVLNEGEAVALVSSAETATAGSAVGVAGVQPYDFGIQFTVEPKNIPTIRATGMVVGSRWALQKVSNGELIAQGVTEDGTMEYTYYGEDVPLYVRLKVRKASESPRYKPFEVTFYLTADDITIPVSQVLDE